MTSARDIAFKVLGRVERDNAFAAAALSSEMEKTNDPRDAALATQIVMGVLRRQPWLDQLIDSALVGKKKINPNVLRILRIGVYQIAFLDSIPHRAAVSEAVNQAKRLGATRAGGLINAVLRRQTEKSIDELLPQELDDDDVKALAKKLGQPQWLLEKIIKGFGREEAISICHAFNEPSLRSFRVNVNRMPREQVLQQLGENAEVGRFTPWSVHTKKGAASEELLSKGLASIQDEGAQLVALALDPQEGERILDACSGRGGKTSALAMMTSGKADIWAADRGANKLERLKFELGRQGFEANTVVADLEKEFVKTDELFDRILLDAPCSGTGTLGRRPEIRWRLEPRSIKNLVKIQAAMLHTVSAGLKPKGRLVYAVCSILPEEGKLQAEEFLQKHPQFSPIDTPPADWPHQIQWQSGGALINPANTNTDGYQIFAFEKR